MPNQGYNTPPELSAMLQSMDARIQSLERTRTIPMGTTTPTSAPADGAMQGDTSGPYLWLRVGGAWKRTAALV